MRRQCLPTTVRHRRWRAQPSCALPARLAHFRCHPQSTRRLLTQLLDLGSGVPARLLMACTPNPALRVDAEPPRALGMMTEQGAGGGQDGGSLCTLPVALAAITRAPSSSRLDLLPRPAARRRRGVFLFTPCPPPLRPSPASAVGNSSLVCRCSSVLCSLPAVLRPLLSTATMARPPYRHGGGAGA